MSDLSSKEQFIELLDKYADHCTRLPNWVSGLASMRNDLIEAYESAARPEQDAVDDDHVCGVCEGTQRGICGCTAHEPAHVPIPLELAKRFHESYERLSAGFGYETRPETRVFDPESPNGKLMIAVCTEILRASSPPAVTPLAKAACCFAGKVKDSYILKLWFESQEDLDAAFDLVDDAATILPMVPIESPSETKEVRHKVTCKLFPDPHDERDPVGPCTCGASAETSNAPRVFTSGLTLTEEDKKALLGGPDQ